MKNLNLFKNKDSLFIIGIFVITLSVYLYTLAPSVYWLDSAIYLVSIKVFGVSYSPGYPLYTLLSKLWSYIPIPGLNFTQKINLLSSIFASITNVFLYLTIVNLLKKYLDPDKYTIIRTAGSHSPVDIFVIEHRSGQGFGIQCKSKK